jgi:hypothetical protein
MLYYHYTSRHAAQDIICIGQILPGSGGLIYLSPTPYTVGHEAANELGITKKPVEVRCEIPDDRVVGLTGLPAVPLITDPSGNIIRRGGGSQIGTINAISVNPLNWFSLAEP